MKNYFTILLSLLFLTMACDKDEWYHQNPYLPEYAFNLPINTHLPLYNQLQYPGNAIYVPGYGINGVLVINTGTGIRAFEATCSNHGIGACSKLTLKGVEAICGCSDALVYNLYLGLATGDAEYPLKEYRVIHEGSMITVFN